MYRLWGLISAGLFTALLLYPITHELGHAMAALAFGGEIIEIGIFPTPYTVCEMRGVSELGICLTGLCGMILPLLLSCFKIKQSFWLFYINKAFCLICSVSYAVSAIFVILHYFGISCPKEDVTMVIERLGKGHGAALLLLSAAFFQAVKNLDFWNLLDRCTTYFEAL